MKAKDTTEQKDTQDKALKSLKREVLKLTHNLDEQKKKRDRRDTYLYGFVIFFISLGLVGALLSTDWLRALLSLTTLLWIGLCWMKDRYISSLRHTLDMVFGLRDLETKELEALMAGRN